MDWTKRKQLILAELEELQETISPDETSEQPLDLEDAFDILDDFLLLVIDYIKHAPAEGDVASHEKE